MGAGLGCSAIDFLFLIFFPLEEFPDCVELNGPRLVDTLDVHDLDLSRMICSLFSSEPS